MVDVIDISFEENVCFGVLGCHGLSEIDEYGVSIRNHNIVLAKIAVDEVCFVPQLKDQLDDFLVPVRRGLQSHFSKNRARNSTFPNEPENKNVFLNTNRLWDGYLCLFCEFEILVFFQCPLIYERCSVVWDILESRVSTDVFQSSLTKDVRCC